MKIGGVRDKDGGDEQHPEEDRTELELALPEYLGELLSELSFSKRGEISAPFSIKHLFITVFVVYLHR